MRKFYNVLLLLTATLALSSCAKSEWIVEGETFYLKNEGAVMPVWVTGNVESGVFLITNHGGAGCSTGVSFHDATSFKQLEEKYAVVYWDQRMSGMSMGNPSFDDLTIDLHVEDLEKLVTLLEHKYSPKSMFIHGHSWGGCLAIAYLAKPENRAKISGWIDEAGGLQDRMEMKYRKEWTIREAIEQHGEGSAKHNEVANWWAENPDANEGDWTPYQFVRDLNGYIYDEEKANAQHSVNRFSQMFFSQHMTFWGSIQYTDTSWLAWYDLTEEASEIDIPSLLLWGREDGSVPVEIGMAIDSLITKTEHKKFIIYEECAHSVHWEMSDEFYNEVSSFIEQHKN